MPNHNLKLKKGVPVMLLRNIDQAARLCNGTWLIVLELGVNIISYQVVVENNIDEKVYIARMNMILLDAVSFL